MWLKGKKTLIYSQCHKINKFNTKLKIQTNTSNYQRHFFMTLTIFSKKTIYRRMDSTDNDDCIVKFMIK
jgi:hypothetical protein